MIELTTRRREMRGKRTNHHEKMGLKRMWGAIPFTISDTAGTSPDPVCGNTDTRSSQPNQASRTPAFSYPLISSISFSSSSPICLFLVHNATIIAEHKVKSSLTISPCHDHELTRSTSMHRVPHTWSTAYMEYSIHPRVFSRPFILMNTSWPLNVASGCGVPPYTIDRHQAALHVSSNVKSPSHIPTVVSWLTDA